LAEATLQEVMTEGTQTKRQSFGPDTESGKSQERNLTKLAGPDCAKEIIRLFVSQDPIHKKHKAQWKVNKLRKTGVTGVVLIKRQDTQEWQAYAPPGSARQVPALNKAARLCRLLRATLFTDPPVPEATPASDSDEDRDAAEFSTRVLIDLGNEGNLDNAGSAEQAFDLSSTYGSGFRHYYTDPQGGGLRPMVVQATPKALRFDLAKPQSSLLDPETETVAAPPYVSRYVRNDLSLTDDPRDPNIRQVWTPKLCNEVLSAQHVRFLPPTARDIWKAQGVVIAGFITLDELRTRLGADKVPSDAASLKKLVAKPSEDVLDLLPGGKGNVKVLELEQGKISGDSLVFVVRCYYEQGPAYPFGFYGIAAGTDMLLYRGEWYNREAKEPLDLPVDQFKQMDNEEDQYGDGMMTIVGPANEIRAGVLGSQLEHLDRFLNRKVFYPINAPLQARAAQAATGTYIPTTPGGIPKTEDVPDFPRAAVEMFQDISEEMDHESGLEPPSTGQSPPSVQSGVHARTIIEQVNVGLSDIRNNLIRGLIRGWRIQLQLVRKDYKIPQRIGWVGDDGDYKEKEWRGSDLSTTRDVMLHKGSLSMLAPSAKLAVAEQMSQMVVGTEPVLSAEDLRRIVIGNVGGLIGLEDDPHRMRIRRQIGQWREGPPAGWQGGRPAEPQPATASAATGQVLADPQAAPAPPTPLEPAPDPVLAEMWAPVPADDDPQVAMLRQHELGRLLASTRYSRWPVEWRAPVDAEYLRMRQAAGIQTVADQQAAAQQAQDAQQQQVDVTQQYAAQVQQLQQQIAALAQQLSSLAKNLGPAVQEQIKPIQQALQQVAAEVKQLASQQGATTKDMLVVARNVDTELAKHKKAVNKIAGDVAALKAPPGAAPVAPPTQPPLPTT